MVNDISEMTQEIQNESQERATEKLKKEQEKQAQLLEKGRKEIVLFRKMQEEKIRAAAEHDFQQNLNRQDLGMKQAILSAKQDVLTQIFAQAALEMNDWSAKQTLDFISKILIQPEFKGNWELILGSKTAEKVGLEQARLTEIMKKNEQAHFNLSSNHLMDECGFVLSQTGIEYNFLYRSLIQEVQGDIEAKISRKLFD